MTVLHIVFEKRKKGNSSTRAIQAFRVAARVVRITKVTTTEQNYILLATVFDVNRHAISLRQNIEKPTREVKKNKGILLEFSYFTMAGLLVSPPITLWTILDTEARANNTTSLLYYHYCMKLLPLPVQRRRRKVEKL